MDKASALQRLKQHQLSARGGGQNDHSAATSHLRNDEYMQEFEKGWQELHDATCRGTGRPGIQTSRPVPGTNAVEPPRAPRLATAAPGQRSFDIASAPTAASSVSITSSHAAPANDLAAVDWSGGPKDEQGTLVALSDRPTLCSAADWSRGEVIVGCSDHALYVIDLKSQRNTRTLYTKTTGHTEWVTSVAVLPDGKVLSGGMDSNLWLWGRGSSRGGCGRGHAAAVSQVAASPTAGLVASCSYDKTVRLWRVGGAAPVEASCLQGHPAPILQMACHPSDHRILTGDRSGHVMLWDTQAEAASWHLKAVHSGHVTALQWHRGDASGRDAGQLFASGGQDGCVRLWDPRARAAVAKLQLHVNGEGKGAVGSIAAGGPSARGMLVTAGADKTVRIADPAAGYQEVACLPLPDFPYHMVTVGGLALVGCGDGTLVVVGIKEGHVLYGLGANRAAVRTIDTDGRRLVCSGDDGNAIVYEF